jgi:hypothetical protein
MVLKKLLGIPSTQDHVYPVGLGKGACPPEKPQGSLILGRPFSVVAESRLRVSPRHSPLLLLVPVMVPMSCLHLISCSFGGVGDDRIVGALAKLGYLLSDQTVKRNRKERRSFWMGWWIGTKPRASLKFDIRLCIRIRKDPHKI